MKKILFIAIFLIIYGSSSGQKKVLSESQYGGWRTIESILISDNADVVLTEYKSHLDKSVLEIAIKSQGFVKEIKGGGSPELFNRQRFARYLIKDTLYVIDLKNGRTDSIGVANDISSHNESGIITFFKGTVKDFHIKCTDATGNFYGREDSISGVVNCIWLNREQLMVLIKNKQIVTINLGQKELFKRDTIFSTERYVGEISASKNGDKIIFFTAADSTGKIGVEAVMLELGKRRGGANFSVEEIRTGLNDSLLPEGTRFNVKKGITFSKNGNFLKFELASVMDEDQERGDKKGKKASVKKDKPAFEYELWRWSDTLLPSQKRSLEGAFANSFKCAFYLVSGKLVRLSYGKGVFLMSDDNSPFGFELDSRPYAYTELWEDPVPKDFYFINAKSGERKMLFKSFIGSFAVSPVTPHIFTFEPDSRSWFVTDLYSGSKRVISDAIPYSVMDEKFDKPQPAGAYGQAGLSLDNSYFIVYDEFDVWALPIKDGSGEAFCITNGYGRKNNVKFKILNLSSTRGQKDGIDLKGDILLEYINLNNMNSGYYKVNRGKDPVALLEGPYKYSFSRRLGQNFFVVKRESFSEAPDYWLTDRDFKLIRRVSNLNNQLADFKTGNTSIISWKDGSGSNQTGVLYTPQDYDSSKTYPTIVYFYETMSQDANYFYTPAPTTSTINPLMFVSRGYVIFMPDIRYEIGWPGRSCLNIVESGTRHLIDKGIADPSRIGLQGHSWGGYQVAYLITQTDIFTCACSETAVANMTSAYTGLRAGAGKPRMFMYESTQSRIGGSLWERQQNYILNSPIFFLDKVKTPLLSRHSDGDEAVPFSQGLELFLGLKRLGKEVWMFNYKGDGHNIKKREIAVDWTKRMDEYFDYYLMGAPKPKWM
jgi:dipeptidyl aminopeptidase/acylaminoacyl peptidase